MNNSIAYVICGLLGLIAGLLVVISCQLNEMSDKMDRSYTIELNNNSPNQTAVEVTHTS
jgi:hypothetical protein